MVREDQGLSKAVSNSSQIGKQGREKIGKGEFPEKSKSCFHGVFSSLFVSLRPFPLWSGVSLLGGLSLGGALSRASLLGSLSLGGLSLLGVSLLWVSLSWGPLS